MGVLSSALVTDQTIAHAFALLAEPLKIDKTPMQGPVDLANFGRIQRLSAAS